MTHGDATTLAPRRLRSAMFVDFDNVFSLLQRLDPDAAKTFAEDPARWVGDLSAGTDADGPFVRRFLVQKCYLNPAPYSRYRPNFTRAGFQVVDCPSLTQQGKSSADINLVLDAMDALAASTRFDEFVFLSADADFTPLVIRCRAADRLVTIVTPGPAAAAYRSVADTVLSADLFLGLLSRTEPDPLLDTGALDTLVPEPAPAAPAQEQPDVGEPVAAGAGGAAGIHSPEATDAAAAAVSRLVLAADRPVILGTAAATARAAEPALTESDWAGAGSFSTWLRRTLPGLAVDTRTPGHVWDPTRFSEADLPASAANGHPVSPLSELQRRVVAITEIPGLKASDYRLVLEQISFDLALYPFVRTEVSKRVRDECARRESPIGRAAINSVMNGLLFAGADLEGEPTPAELATVWTDNVLGLCRGARLELDAADVAEITAWAGGGLVVADPE